MSVHLARAQLLLQQSRPADAEREAGLAAAENPELPQAHALLALCRINQDKRGPALEAALTAVRLSPDDAHFHYIHALVLHRSERQKEALAAAHEAVRLAPDDDESFSLLAAIHLNQGDWQAALGAAEQALALQPDSTEAANFRAMALVRLGRKAEAMQTVDATLRRDPENAFSHANQGWNCLHRNEIRPALDHFREALRLEPELEYAREGMLEALKGRNAVYRVMLQYFLWSARLPPGLQWGLVVGSIVGGRLAIGLARVFPGLELLWWVVLGSLYGFIYLTWTSQPLFNLLLRLDPFGRHVLTAAQRFAANVFAPFFVATLAAVAWFAVADHDLAFVTMFVTAALSICVAITFARDGRNRLVLGAAMLFLAFLGATAIRSVLVGAASAALNNFAYGFLGFQLLANFFSINRR